MLVLTTRVLEPEEVIVGGLKLAVVVGGKPFTSKLTVPVNPVPGVTVTV